MTPRMEQRLSRIMASMLRICRNALALHGQETEAGARPLDAILFCPQCGRQHIDAPEPERGWTNPPHKSHLCHDCGWIWRPMDVRTNGVAEICTTGEADSFPVIRGQAYRPRRKRA
jgi:predicted RNA-binding Zn-ribbon protein involved in translation (DUF1610 family)